MVASAVKNGNEREIGGDGERFSREAPASTLLFCSLIYTVSYQNDHGRRRKKLLK